MQPVPVSWAGSVVVLVGVFNSVPLPVVIRDVRSGEAGEAVPHLKNCTNENKNKSIQLK